MHSDSVGRVEYPLHEAAKRGNVELLQECLQNKVTHLPLHLPRMQCISLKVSVNSLDKSGSTALYWAAHGGHDEVIRLLLSFTPNLSISSQVHPKHSSNKHRNNAAFGRINLATPRCMQLHGKVG